MYIVLMQRKMSTVYAHGTNVRHAYFHSRFLFLLFLKNIAHCSVAGVHSSYVCSPKPGMADVLVLPTTAAVASLLLSAIVLLLLTLLLLLSFVL